MTNALRHVWQPPLPNKKKKKIIWEQHLGGLLTQNFFLDQEKCIFQLSLEPGIPPKIG